MFVKPRGHAPSQRAALEKNTTVFARRSLHRLRLNTPNLSADVLFSAGDFKTILILERCTVDAGPGFILIDPFLILISKSTDGIVEATHTHTLERFGLYS